MEEKLIKAKVSGYMSLVACQFRGAGGEVNSTQLAEAAAAYFGHSEWLDEETHWVWDLALECAGRAAIRHSAEEAVS